MHGSEPPRPTGGAPPQHWSFAEIVEGIHTKHEEAIRLFHEIFRRGVALVVGGRVAEAGTLVDSTLRAAVAGIQRGELRDSCQLPGCVFRMARVQLGLVQSRDTPVPSLSERLSQCSPIETEMLYRYYINRQTARRICRDLFVTHEVLAALLARVRAALTTTVTRHTTGLAGQFALASRRAGRA